jgi:hypothetical protein
LSSSIINAAANPFGASPGALAQSIRPEDFTPGKLRKHRRLVRRQIRRPPRRHLRWFRCNRGRTQPIQIAELLQQVIDAAHQRGTIPQQLVATGTGRLVHPPRHREQQSPLLTREARRDHRAAINVALHHHRRLTHPRNDPVAHRKGLPIRPAPNGKLRQYRASLRGNAPPQLEVFRWINPVDTRPQHRHGHSPASSAP